MALTPMPMPGGGPGGPPPAGPSGGTGPATASSGMPGMEHQGLAGVKAALELLQKSLPQLPFGTGLHQKVLKFVADISKEMGADNSQPGSDDAKQKIAAMARQGPNPQAAAAMQKLFPQPPAGGGAPPPGMAA